MSKLKKRVREVKRLVPRIPRSPRRYRDLDRYKDLDKRRPIRIRAYCPKCDHKVILFGVDEEQRLLYRCVNCGWKGFNPIWK